MALQNSNIFALNIKFGYRIDLARHGIKTIRELIKLERYELKKYTYYYLDVIDEIHSLGFFFSFLCFFNYLRLLFFKLV